MSASTLPTQQTSLAGKLFSVDKLRNIAIIAHVDHGKTTLVDSLFKQSGLYRENQAVAERAMDSGDLEKERGITILSKNTAVPYQDYKINILDTPGHADFSGEVERVLTMVDGALLIVDAVEGPMPQTRFVLRKAMALGLKIVVVINKIDRPAANCERVLDRLYDLFIELGANEEQLEFPIVYACGLQGTSTLDMAEPLQDLSPLFETIVNKVPAPPCLPDGSLQLQVSTLDYNDYLGRLVIGRIQRGRVTVGQTVGRLPNGETELAGKNRITKLFGFEGLKRLEIQEAEAGDIVAIAGIEVVDIGDILCDPENPEALPPIIVEEPTLQMAFAVNTSPLAGREGKYVTSRNIKDRLDKEIRSNISLRVEQGQSTDTFLVSGRGELHLSILIETMRREGYEFQVGKPRVITKKGEDGETLEPYEQLFLDLPEEMTGSAIERLAPRKAELRHMETDSGRTLLEFHIPARGLLGFRSEYVRMTKGQGLINTAFMDFKPWAGEIGNQRNGAIIANEAGDTTAYALKNLEDRGRFFVEPRVNVYRGMIVGEYNRQQDLSVNVTKTKKLTNMRSAGSETLDGLTPPVDVTLEFALDFIASDELIEVTPKSIRLRKEDMNIKV
jgi:GTP-binding protein